MVRLGLILALLVSAAVAADPATHTRQTIHLDDGTPAAAVFLPADGGRLFLVIAQPAHGLTCWTVTRTQPDPQPDPPEPDPKPQPEPQPDPKPNTEAIRVTIVHRPEATPAALVGVILSPRWRESLTAPNALLGVVTPDVIDWRTGQTPVELSAALRAAATVDLPALVLESASGRLLHVGPVPDTETRLLEILDQHKPRAPANVPDQRRHRIPRTRLLRPACA